MGEIRDLPVKSQRARLRLGNDGCCRVDLHGSYLYSCRTKASLQRLHDLARDRARGILVGSGYARPGSCALRIGRGRALRCRVSMSYPQDEDGHRRTQGLAWNGFDTRIRTVD